MMDVWIADRCYALDRRVSVDLDVLEYFIGTLYLETAPRPETWDMLTDDNMSHSFAYEVSKSKMLTWGNPSQPHSLELRGRIYWHDGSDEKKMLTVYIWDEDGHRRWSVRVGGKGYTTIENIYTAELKLDAETVAVSL